MSISLDRLAQITEGELNGVSRAIRFFLTDTRKIHIAEGSIYIAIEGTRYDGHDFVKEAYDQGVRSFIISQKVELPDDCSTLFVEDTLRAFQQIAKAHRAQFKYPVIGITGSYGKTQIKDRIADLLRNKYHVIRPPRSYNSQTGVPLSLMGMNSSHTLGVFEAGISMPGEMKRLADMITPDIGIFTTIGQAHAEGFDNQQKKLDEKIGLFESSEVIIYCRDHQEVHEAIQQRYGNSEKMLFHWGYSPDSTLHIVDAKALPHDDFITYCAGGETHTTLLKSSSSYDFENGMHILSLFYVLGIAEKESKLLFKKETERGIHTEIIGTPYGKGLLYDIGPIDVPSIRTDVEQIDSLISHSGIQVILIDPSGSPIKNDRKIQALCDVLKGSDLYCIGGGFKNLTLEVNQSQSFESNNEFMKNSSTILDPEKAILLKGAWSPELIELKSFLQEQTQQTAIYVNLESLIHNLNCYRKIIPPQTKVMAMVKAFGYGSGDAEVARILQYHKVDYLGVAYPDEGVALRSQDVQLPIMVMNSSPEAFSTITANRLEPEIFSLNLLKAFIEHLQSIGSTSYPIHLKFDTGMHRLGLSAAEKEEALQLIEQHDQLRLISVFSHLYASDSENRKHSETQIQQFETIKAFFNKSLSNPPLYHLLNSAGISRFPQANYDMVRLGIGLYGFSADSAMHQKLRPVISWNTVVSQIKEVKSGETIGYGGELRIEENKRIAILPVGYADGLSRILGNGKGKVVIKGQQCPFIGNICMDMSMVDLQGLNCAEGDPVELIGSHLRIEEIAKDRETIPYEVLTSIPPRVKRHYIFRG